MGIILKDDGPKYDPVPVGMHNAVCSRIIDLGEGETGGQYNKIARQTMITWEIPEEQIEIDGKMVPRRLDNIYTQSFGEKANLRKMLESWRGRPFTEEELNGFDLDNILGKGCQLNVFHNKRNDRTYANIKDVVPLAKGMPTLTATELVSFVLSADTLDQLALLPEKIQSRIKKSNTYIQLTGGVSPENQGPFHEDDDAPYPEDQDLPF
jgi:hypothetical protein